MSLHTRLTRRRNSGIYYCRVAVPALLQSALGKRELWVSLKTSDARQALERVRLASVEIDSILAGARGGSIEPDQSYTSLHNRITSRSHVTFAQLVERFANLPEKQVLGHKTKLEYRITFRLFTELLGADTPIHRITRAHCRRVQEVLSQLPPNSAKRFPGVHPAKVIEVAKRDNLAPMTAKTANNLITRLCAMLGWAHREGLIQSNPGQGLYLPEDEHNRDKRHPFTVEQLNAIFNSDTMQRHRAGNNAQWWIPMLALWTGCRLNELCQLHTGDVTAPAGINALLIREGDGKRLKTANAQRTIPLHPMLLKLGFLEYVETIRQRGETRLFPELPVNKRGNASDQFSKRFGFFLKDIEVKTEKTCFHSFRHCFRDALREAGTPREIVRALGGWTRAEGVEDDYGSGFSVKKLHKAICKVEYAGLCIK